MATLRWYGDALLSKIQKAQAKGIDETTIACVAKAKMEAPITYGDLRGSIQMRPATLDLRGVVGHWGSFNLNYPIYVELGTRPHFPPVDMLKEWARRKLGDENLAFPVALKIAREGTKPNPFLMPAADQEYPKLAGRIRRHYKNG